MSEFKRLSEEEMLDMDVSDLWNAIEDMYQELDKYRWIPVKEALPDNDTFVEILTDSGVIYSEIWSIGKSSPSITHWRYPVLPKEEGES